MLNRHNMWPVELFLVSAEGMNSREMYTVINKFLFYNPISLEPGVALSFVAGRQRDRSPGLDSR